MFTRIRSIYQTIGVMLFLIAMYLVLSNYTGAVQLIQAVGNTARGVGQTLQARDKPLA